MGGGWKPNLSQLQVKHTLNKARQKVQRRWREGYKKMQTKFRWQYLNLAKQH